MLPHQKNKVDISSLTEEEKKLFKLYGKLPARKDILASKLNERKYFDSGDYALSKAGKASDAGVTNVGYEHPSPESIPHHVGTPQSPVMSPAALMPRDSFSLGASAVSGSSAGAVSSGLSASPPKERRVGQGMH
ncbi:hypothetical protein G7K_2634-t1 [Saitoella complicata NRRL Y-17804]|uniref:mRNA stability protein n=2 Tax=Saitoella complicata (strain BCRC 22490 / CBS 7301 / JCM 7358 / NBRC 10748 / NRRL Y-17804) TaxID=698492 RepID=A0A0E9NFK0_SAICN|nr:hypothetical protein G7K_2634-t1 [Saitoella complicata NRRL Y-17804]